MDSNEKKTFWMGLLIGAVAGGVVSAISVLLIAPYSGEVTRRLIKARGETMKSNAELRLNEAMNDLQSSLNRANDSVKELMVKPARSAQILQKPSAIAGRVVEKALE